MSIKERLKEFSGYKMFCTPGHKGSLLKEDITEIEGFFPLKYIEEAQEKTAKFYGVFALRYLLGGSSQGVKAALMGFGDVLAQTNSHKSVFDGAEIANSRVFFISTDTENGLIMPPTKKQIESALDKFPSAKTVVLTSPDYYGMMADAGIGKIIKKAGRRLHIDAAHGAHLFFRPDLFDTSIFKYADSFNLSAHKTLGAYTQTAYLAINDEKSIKAIDHNLDLLSSTSPFYPFYAGLEEAADYAYENKEYYSVLINAVKLFKKRIVCAKNHDFTRLAVDCYDLKLEPSEVFLKLKECGIIAEKFDERYIIFIITLCDSASDIDMLATMLERVKEGKIL